MLKVEKIVNWIKRNFGLKGSWIWACKQMHLGEIVKSASDSSCKYKMSNDWSYRLLWAFTHDLDSANWQNANMFLKTMTITEQKGAKEGHGA